MTSSGVFIVNSEHIRHLFLVFLWMALNKKNVSWVKFLLWLWTSIYLMQFRLLNLWHNKTLLKINHKCTKTKPRNVNLQVFYNEKPNPKKIFPNQPMTLLKTLKNIENLKTLKILERNICSKLFFLNVFFFSEKTFKVK